MISGLKNLAYIARGMRTYGSKPVLARPRSRWEFQFVLAGAARPTTMEPAPETQFQPRLYVFHPDSPHGWTDDDGAVSHIFVAQFNDIPEEVGERVPFGSGLRLTLDKNEHNRWTTILEEAWKSAHGEGAGASLRVHRLLLDLATLVVERADGIGERKIEPTDKITRAIHWMEENLGEHPTVADAARAAGISAAHLRRLCAQAGRPGPHRELARLRLAAAQRCLREGWKQTAIADYLGFSEVSAFARAFRDGCGHAPGAWLTKVRKNARAS